MVFQPSRVRILAVGRLRRSWLADGVAQYHRRLPGLELVEIRDSTPQREGREILARLSDGERLVALSETGRSLDSEAFSRQLSRWGCDRVAFAIGGADGLIESVISRASCCLSLSAMTLPHDLARLVLIEQIYRARTIAEGGPYHRA
ncbi:23S rRNA (pseudouridine(1915)-N(3))-methyltransferase RlmH [Synechococcus sp. RSCCF101]|uniref:23S rRNA (pseudouridine(1915)-N(3))-methyltransferase RlmH n=1 Tax=Synechococcus sp. RSCCF101 TaxID=2511069 RepID=UPI001243B224|nr:23S rRNA (pseudouridine(1915)-N(3))-methyltransferase RlmH [Synechococcus sp. RSCCF101]QEY31571.1 23S rRNA (pseudouridine(1915)-N(3))-methyltransferase RlmH [Synechococcus sp. RSCCF101]